MAAQPDDSYSISGHGTRVLEGRGGLTIKVLVEGANLGGAEVEIGEMTVPANSPGGEVERLAQFFESKPIE